eukprot:1158751-Pelagomonas_calceolata.AAC.7
MESGLKGLSTWTSLKTTLLQSIKYPLANVCASGKRNKTTTDGGLTRDPLESTHLHDNHCPKAVQARIMCRCLTAWMHPCDEGRVERYCYATATLRCGYGILTAAVAVAKLYLKFTALFRSSSRIRLCSYCYATATLLYDFVSVAP